MKTIKPNGPSSYDNIMKFHPIAFLLVLSVSAIAGMPESTPLKDANLFLQSLASAETVEIFEGLPHQMFEGDLMKNEEKRTDITRIARFPRRRE
jgi:hypothetical protein